jgi:predicted nucleotidyltransferase component of viral defense system
MKAQLVELVRNQPEPYGRNLAREFLQALILSSLQQAGAMVPLAFQGGTALRFLFSIPRYSEDLDFALERSAVGYDFRRLLERVRTDLTSQTYQVMLKVNDRSVVNSAFIRFPGLLYEIGLSAHQNESIAVKLEVDTNPPPGAGLATTIIRRHVLLNIQHHDRASLFAGKVHAILQRKYPKGRDIFDLVWYLSDPEWPVPNLVLLNNALLQTDWAAGELTEKNWRAQLVSRLKGLDWNLLLKDVRPFLENSELSAFINRDSVLSLLE